MIKRTLLTSFAALLTATVAEAQILKPGFDKQEYIECLAMTSHLKNLTVDEKYMCPAPESFHRLYACPQTGFDNEWELWQDNRGVCAIVMRATISTMTSWGANFNAGMVPAQGSVHVVTDKEYDLCADSSAHVHAGWVAGLMTMSDDIVAKLDSCHKAGCRDFLIAGHSQGGALSYLVTAMLRRMQAKGLISADITFKTYASAAPKPGDYLFALNYEAMTQPGWSFTVINSEDWVPETPLSVQRPTDFRPTNPFNNMDELLSGAGAIQRAKIHFLYNRIYKPTQKSVDNLTKYLGGTVGGMLEEGLVWFKKPVEYSDCANYARCGQFYILLPDDDYFAKHPHVAADAFEHHQYVSYYELAQKIK